jgi:2-polyprenyl-3-methyl-5-hydroxy-6-metoxy-1,4-benzoquinol methylase
MGLPNVFGWLMAKVFGKLSFLAVSSLGLATPKSKILNVGCGSGALLNYLYTEGFSNLTGADPYIDQDFAHAGGISVHKKGNKELEGKFDLIMFHHSFEHIEDQLGTLQQAVQKWAKSGVILLGLPLSST